MKPLVSVVIPTFNVAKYLPETLESLKKQTIKKALFETIIIDDCSTDDTFNICKKYKNKLGVLVGNNKNYGAAYTKNKGILLAQGKYIMLLDGDDLFEPETIEKTLEFMQTSPELEFSYSRHKRINEKGEFICNRPGYEFSRERLLHFNFVGAVECFSKNLFKKLQGFDDSCYVEDYDFSLRASEVLNNNQFRQNPLYLYQYRIHNSNKSNNLDVKRKAAALAIQNSLKRKEGINTEVFWSHITNRYNYFDWEEKK